MAQRYIHYERLMEQTLQALQEEGRVPKLLLHSCCAPCSTYVLAYLSPYFDIVDFYYNPNISEAEEYERRAAELARLIRDMPLVHEVRLLRGHYEPERFFAMAKGLEEEPEKGARCLGCYALRLREAAEAAVREHCDFFTTTLSISPKKDAQQLNRIGIQIGEEVGVPYLPSDFKKHGGFDRSTELSERYGLYRQDYCGCVFSKRDAARRRERHHTT